jgi:hypothetical protein
MMNFIVCPEVDSDRQPTTNWLVYEEVVTPSERKSPSVALVQLAHNPIHGAAYKRDWYTCRPLIEAATAAIKEAFPKKIPPIKILDGPFEEVKESVLSALKAHFVRPGRDTG